MNSWPSFPRKPYLTLIVDRGEGEPVTIRIAVRQLERALALVCTVFLCLGAGSLLFFREVSQNRVLSDRLLSLELSRSLAVNTPANAQQHAAAQAAATTTAPSPTGGAATVSALVTAPREVAEQTSTPATTNDASAKLTGMYPECQEGVCRLRYSLGTSHPGTAQGHVLVVLETSLARIGIAAPDAPSRKRFLVYPGNRSFDAVDDSLLAGLDGSRFQFTKSLQAVAEFNVGKTLLPLALNLYVYGKNGELLRHERRSLESGE